MRWVGLEASVVFAAPCDGARGGAKGDGGHWGKAS
jgi:hypothetical protein